MTRLSRAYLIERTRERLIRRSILDASGCWLWLGALSHDRYGAVRLLGQKRKVHRVAYELFREPIPAGFTVDHNCFVRHCVNPYHLDIRSVSENCARKLAAVLPHCLHGHTFTPENTYMHAGRRFCRACGRAAQSRLKAKRAEIRV